MNTEAAKYRKRAQAAETTRDLTRAKLTKAQRIEMENHLNDTIISVELLEAAEISYEKLCDETGIIDPAKITEAIQTATEHFNLPTGPSALHNAIQIAPVDAPKPQSWTNLLSQ